MAQEAGVFPKSLKSYVQRALALCKDEKQSAACQEIMKETSTGILSCALYQAAVEEGIVGGGCTSLRLASKVDAIKDSLDNDEEKVGADIVKRALSYPLKLMIIFFLI
uniref:Uncharacterized protein n=1 Tax=Gossypium raimondii TaxID=29730 RepID=A0A0D2U9W1_GOSRA|nr:hypothetical protein B456_010G062100 [Gossypium raimondii]